MHPRCAIRNRAVTRVDRANFLTVSRRLHPSMAASQQRRRVSSFCRRRLAGPRSVAEGHGWMRFLCECIGNVATFS
ncbi:unnamed protein product [Sphagnum tenellum]